jgi:hypothetical protein
MAVKGFISVMEKPDNVAEKPNLLPYGSNVGAPSIRIENIQFWKETKVNKVNHLFDEKFNSIKKDYEKLLEEYEWNNLVYKSNFNFEPTIGQTYYLYSSDDDKTFLSLIEPNQWNKKYIGSFFLNHECKWVKV